MVMKIVSQSKKNINIQINFNHNNLHLSLFQTCLVENDDGEVSVTYCLSFSVFWQ